MSRPSPEPVRPLPTLGNPDAALYVSRGLLETLPDATIAVDSAGTIIETNSQAQELFGYRRDELVGQKIEILVPESSRHDHVSRREGFTHNPVTRRMGSSLDLYGRRRNGSQFPVEISLSPVSTGKGFIVLSAIRDISDRKRIESELRRVQEELYQKTAEQLGAYRTRLASIIDSSEDAIIGKDLNGTITSWNRGAEKIYGYTAEEAIGKNISMLAPPDRPDEIPGILQRIAHGEPVEHVESVRVTKDGRSLNVFLSVSPLRDSQGNVVGASAIARDITEQKRTEGRLHQSQKLEAIGRLAGGIAHDFNNILGIIHACKEFLFDRIDPKTESAVYIENIGKAVDRGTSLTRQLLAFSRSSTIKPRLLDLNERLKDTSKLLRPLMGDDVEILIVSKSPVAVVEADPGQLDQIVINLAVNARDAMPQGGKFILEASTIAYEEAFAGGQHTVPPGKYVLLAVSDTGSGMDEATAARAFEPFFTTKETGKGTGLGLATVYGIVKQNAGHILVYSEPGHGSTFKIYLPSAENKLGLESDSEVAGPAPKARSATILLAEDDEIMRGLTRTMLEGHGYTVVEADDGKSALEKAAAHQGRIDLLLTDVVMRRVSGPELAEQLTASHPELKVVYMSGYTGELIKEREVVNRDITLLEKPFTRNALLDAVHTALG